MESKAEEDAVRTCAYCPKQFSIPPSAEHKRFCSEKCRNDWHTRELRAARQVMKDLRGKEQPA